MEIPIPATISKITTMADKSLRLQVDTQEVSPQEKSDIFAHHDTLGWFVFADAPIKEVKLDELPKIVLDEEEKSPSARLRAVLYVYWKDKNLSEDFEVFYRRKMNSIIESVKGKLD